MRQAFVYVLCMPKNHKNHIVADILRKIRSDTGLTQTQAGLAMNVSNVYVSNLETGKRSPSIIQLIRFCDAIGVDPEQAFRLIVEKYRSVSNG